MNKLTIGTVSCLTDLPQSTIRYYEQVGILPEASRVHGQRRYDESIVVTIELVKAARRAGFSIAEIAMMAHDEKLGSSLSHRWRSLARGKVQELDESIRRIDEAKRLLEAGTSCECTDLSSCSLRMIT